MPKAGRRERGHLPTLLGPNDTGGTRDQAGLVESRVQKGSNRVQAPDAPVHGWYQFVLSFPPHLVREYIHDFALHAAQKVMDPFCGTGTTLVECAKLGIDSVGVERNPIAWYASKVKTDWRPDPEGLYHHAQQVAEAVTETLATRGIHDGPGRLTSATGEVNVAKLRKLPESAAKLIIRNSISPLPLHKTLTLLHELEGQKELEFYDHERLAVASALPSDIGNLRFGPEVGVGKIRHDAAVVEPWLRRVAKMAEDLKEVPRERTARVILGDARNLDSSIKKGSIDAVVTSPPYPNEKDYTRICRLESVILGFWATNRDIRDVKQDLVRSNTRSVYKADEDDLLVRQNPEIRRIADQIEERRISLGKESGFERLYSRLIGLYFGGMQRHLAGIRPCLRKGARLAYVVGDQASYLQVMIRTGKLLANLATSLGYQVERIDLFRKRFATATSRELREEVVVLRWPGHS